MINPRIRRAVRLALASGAAIGAVYSTAASAQDQQEAAAASELGTVVVTGSRIPQPNLTSISPVTAVSSDEVRLEGVTRVEDLVNNLPQAFADFGANISNGATGAATVNLRGLGSQRTLVLVNSRRLMPGDPTQNGNGTADLNQIPTSLVERVEVLTGGASAVYGADAVAGVVNFIMNDHFEGVRLDAQYSFYQHDNSNSEVAGLVADHGFQNPDSNVMDGYTTDATFVLGLNSADGHGNATIYAGYRNIDALLQSERDYSACTLNSGDSFTCGGSSTASPARFQAIDQDPLSPTFQGETGPALTLDTNGALRPFTAADQYNFGPLNYYQRPDERYTAGVFAHYDFNEHATAYTEFMFMNDESIAQIAPSGLFRGGGPVNGQYIVNCDNPFMTPEQVQTFCTDQGLASTDDTLISVGKRNAEGGGRADHLEHTSYRAVIGARGNFSDAWSYDVYGLYGTTDFQRNYLNDFSVRRVGNALAAVDDGAGNVVCRVNADADTTNDDPACVPYNMFQPGGVTPEALNYVQIPGFQAGSTTEQVLSGAITGDLGAYGVKMPWAQDGLGLAIGAEYRREESELRADVAFQTADLAGQGGATLDTQGAFDVREMFVEARLPIAQDRTGAQSLSLEAGYRYSDYSLGFDTDAYKLGADWAPVEDIRFRASYQRAVRAPNIQELFRPQVVQLDGNTDPCAVDNPGVDTPAATLEQCALTGVTPGQYGNIASNPAAQYNGLTGGEPALQPESSDTYSYGFVFTPRFLPRFSLSVDYFDIKVEDLIGPYGSDLVLNNCITTAQPNWCSLIHRAPGSGSLWLGSSGYVTDLNVNTGSLQTKGIDTEINYALDLGGSAGRLSFQLIGTYVDQLSIEPVTDAPTYDCVGLFGTVCGIPSPEWRHKVRLTWATPWDLDLSLSWRYIDSVVLDHTQSDPQLSGDVPATDAKLDAMSYLDLAGSYTFRKSLTLRVGINNITDEEPPLVGQDTAIPAFVSGNTFSQVYDTLGRYGFISLTADF